MALTEAEKLDALLALGLPARVDAVFSYQGDSAELRRAEVATQALSNLNAAQEAKVRDLLTKYACVETETTLVNAEGANVSPYRERARIRGLIAKTIGFTLGESTGIQIQRG
jgi:hypothetical protein